MCALCGEEPGWRGNPVKVLTDSEILIEVLRGRDEDILARWRDLAQSSTPISYCPVTEAEVWACVRSSEQITLAKFFGTLCCAAIDAEIGRKAGGYLREFRKSHGVEIA